MLYRDRLPAAFVRDGFARLDGFLGRSEVADVQAAVDALATSTPACTCSRPHNTLLPLRWTDSAVRLILASRRRMLALAGAVGADDLKWISGYISIKEANSPPLWWHQDWWCWDHAVSFEWHAPQIAVLCYLQATDEHNGALRVLPGSHHRSSAIHCHLPEPHGSGTEALEPGHVAMRDHPKQVTLRMAVGDAVAIDYRLLHGTHANARDVRRDCVLLSFTPCWRELPEDIRGHLIEHCALPTAAEQLPDALWAIQMLPRFCGTRKNLPVNRMAPAQFEIK